MIYESAPLFETHLGVNSQGQRRHDHSNLASGCSIRDIARRHVVGIDLRRRIPRRTASLCQGLVCLVQEVVTCNGQILTVWRINDLSHSWTSLKKTVQWNGKLTYFSELLPKTQRWNYETVWRVVGGSIFEGTATKHLQRNRFRNSRSSRFNQAGPTRFSR